ncbi:MAG: sigma-70 family RNA polymerase sigma factor [Alteromonadaceae bacterium]|nr:sigma-70 family RNA polymerase sigma factor [Alteromonadaceae bacterium]
MSVAKQSSTNKEDLLWQRWLAEQDYASREKLFELYANWAVACAIKLYLSYQIDGAEKSDFIHCAHEGLLEAIDNYDPENAASFLTYSHYRIKGAILRSIVTYSEKSQYISKSRELQRERQKSIIDSICEDDNDALDQLVDLVLDFSLTYFFEIDEIEDSQYSLLNNKSYNSDEMRLLQKNVLEELSKLPSLHQKIIKYHYFCQLRFSDIAEIIGVTSGRISQCHGEALKLLRKIRLNN